MGLKVDTTLQLIMDQSNKMDNISVISIGRNKMSSSQEELRNKVSAISYSQEGL
jgi:hypothetical protein